MGKIGLAYVQTNYWCNFLEMSFINAIIPAQS